MLSYFLLKKSISPLIEHFRALLDYFFLMHG